MTIFMIVAIQLTLRRRWNEQVLKRNDYISYFTRTLSAISICHIKQGVRLFILNFMQITIGLPISQKHLQIHTVNVPASVEELSLVSQRNSSISELIKDESIDSERPHLYSNVENPMMEQSSPRLNSSKKIQRNSSFQESNYRVENTNLLAQTNQKQVNEMSLDNNNLDSSRIIGKEEQAKESSK